MLTKQEILKVRGQSRMHVTCKLPSGRIGFMLGGRVKIYSNGKMLHITKGNARKGFVLVEKVNIFKTRDRMFMALPHFWVEDYLADTDSLSVYYTKIGLFVRPFVDKYSKYVL